MNKIMFNDRYGFTEAVLSGRKTQTRRIITCPKEFKGEWVAGFYVYKRQSDNAIIQWPCMYDADECTFDGGEILPKYKVGEVIAIAQAYKNIACGALYDDLKEIVSHRKPEKLPGWSNKMFVRADLMPHQIRITNVRVERLQDISDDDCLAEGIYKDDGQTNFNGYAFQITRDQYGNMLSKQWYSTPPRCYAALIDRTLGKGSWDSNPYVFVYDFELVK